MDQTSSLLQGLPAQARDLIVEQLRNQRSRPVGLGIGAAVSIVIALWSASGGVSQLLTAINVAYDEEETALLRRQTRPRAGWSPSAPSSSWSSCSAWSRCSRRCSAGWTSARSAGASDPALGRDRGIVSVALAVIYRVGPDRDAPKIRWVSVGAVRRDRALADRLGRFRDLRLHFGNYAKTYGAVAGIVVMLFWLWITSYAILLGAEINAEAEQQTARDSTHGPEQPLGQRGAVKADSLPDRQASRTPRPRTKQQRDRLVARRRRRLSALPRCWANLIEPAPNTAASPRRIDFTGCGSKALSSSLLSRSARNPGKSGSGMRSSSRVHSVGRRVNSCGSSAASRRPVGSSLGSILMLTR